MSAACAEFGIHHSSHDGVASALASHWRWLRRMGRAIADVRPAVAAA